MWNDDLSYIGTRDVWGGQKLFGLSPAARHQHLYILGQTGTGKSSLLRNLIIQDLERGRGIGLIDPHGDLATDILDGIPPHRTDHVIYFNPADHEYPVAFNVLKTKGNPPHLVASSIVGALKSIWRDSWGSLLVTQFQLAAMSRANVPALRRTPFHLYVDEFHNFATDSFASILSEARKYGLALTLVSQFSSQTRPEITNAVFGNVGTIISFRVGEADAALLSRQFDDTQPGAFTSLGNHRILVKPLIEDGYTMPFRATTMAPLNIRTGRRRVVIARSRERFSTKREIVESRIGRWIGERNPNVQKRKRRIGTKRKSPHRRQRKYGN